MLTITRRSVADRWFLPIIAGFAILIPLVVSTTGKDSFRLPKEIMFRAEVIVLIGLCTIFAYLRQLHFSLNRSEVAPILALSVVSWGAVATLYSTNIRLSLGALSWLIGWTIIFIVTMAVSHRRTNIFLVYACLIPAVLNSIVVLFQETSTWNPFFSTQLTEHVFHSGMIGNPNDVGTFLVGPIIASFALVVAEPRHRLLHCATTSVLLVAAGANHTLTALIAISIGVICLIFVLARKWTLLAVASVAAVVLLTVRFYPPLYHRYQLTKTWASSGLYDSILSGRILPFFTSSRMFLDHPLTGVGPGCFKWQYFPYKMRIISEFGPSITRSNAASINFGEVHNDHLQILAESGFPGYLLFIGALAYIASGSFTSFDSSRPESVFSRVASFPLAVGFAVVALGQFPLELAAPTAANVYLFALCASWRSAEPS